MTPYLHIQTFIIYLIDTSFDFGSISIFWNWYKFSDEREHSSLQLIKKGILIFVFDIFGLIWFPWTWHYFLKFTARFRSSLINNDFGLVTLHWRKSYLSGMIKWNSSMVSVIYSLSFISLLFKFSFVFSFF